MSTRDRTLLGEIESDLLNDKPLEDVLLKVLALGGRASSGPMRDWASHELNGYAESDSDLPSYRRVPASIKIDAVLGYNMIQGQTIGILSLPEAVRNDIKEEVELPFGVAELEDLVRDTNKDGLVRVTFQLSADVAKLMSRSLP
ncbi:MAG TPA: hypothetical protein VFB06_08210, partial [Streptosporangiaceae bacterium]|nr:hypothetical protein [Streptosporangiaceae bacterium]